jgi:hypothetical protein
MLGNTLLVISTLFMLGLLYYTSSPSPGGDRAVGYAFMLLIFGGGFFILTALLAWNLGATHRFDWLPTFGGGRGLLIFLGWLAFVLTVLFGSMFKSEWHAGELPEFLHWLAKAQVSFWLPVLMLAPVFFLINFWKAGEVAPPAFVQIPMKTGFAVSLLMCAGMLFGFARAKILLEKGRYLESKANAAGRLDEFEKGIIADIDSCDLSKNMVFLLVHTDEQRNPIIRQRALAKIKTRPDWQEELARRLDSGWAPDVFTFLASNEVDDKSLFPEAVRKGVLQQAEIIRKTFRESREMYDGQYGPEVECVLRTVEKFEGMGVDFLPAVRALRAAFDQPSPFGKTNVRPAAFIDKWLKKRR